MNVFLETIGLATIIILLYVILSFSMVSKYTNKIEKDIKEKGYCTLITGKKITYVDNQPEDNK